jgi:uroporphyrinogen decarboxylase
MAVMNARQNILSLYRRTGYQHAPVLLDMCPSMWDKYRAVAGKTPLEEYFEYPEGFVEQGVPGLQVVDRGPIDWAKYYPDGVKEGAWFDAYGVAHEPGSSEAAHMTRMRHPMAGFTSLEQMQAYPFPQWDMSSEARIAEGVADAHRNGKAAAGHMACTVWETAWYIRDMTMLMMDMSMGDEKASYLLDAVTRMASAQAAAHARSGVDIIHMGDDIGMQHAIMMSMEMYREWIKPRLAAVIAAAKAARPDVLVFYHSCGYVEPFIPDLIDAGIDILNPVQPECMSFATLHKQYGDRIAFNGTLGTQTTMPFGTPKDVREVVLLNLEMAGPMGGRFVTPPHLLEPEVPWENVVAYVQACKEYSAI